MDVGKKAEGAAAAVGRGVKKVPSWIWWAVGGIAGLWVVLSSGLLSSLGSLFTGSAATAAGTTTTSAGDGTTGGNAGAGSSLSPADEALLQQVASSQASQGQQLASLQNQLQTSQQAPVAPPAGWWQSLFGGGQGAPGAGSAAAAIAPPAPAAALRASGLAPAASVPAYAQGPSAEVAGSGPAAMAQSRANELQQIQSGGGRLGQ